VLNVRLVRVTVGPGADGHVAHAECGWLLWPLTGELRGVNVRVSGCWGEAW
jgi:hypothetical protein